MASLSVEGIAILMATPALPPQLARDRLTSLESRYEEPWRHYHTFEHPMELLDILLANMPEVQDPEAVGWSMLYHDGVYDPVAEYGRNEELSARLAEHELPALIGQDKAKLVASYTRATAKHVSLDTDPDLDFFLDADLVILGSDPDRYARYSKDIRLEYAHVPDEVYTTARIGVLEGLAKRVQDTGLYRTELFRARYEDQAQENIALESDQLRLATT